MPTDPNELDADRSATAHALIFGIVGLLAAVLIARAGAVAMLHFAPASVYHNLRFNMSVPRIKQLLDALPKVANAPAPTAIAFGSSTTELGFSPSVFDERMKEIGRPVTTFNMGIAALDPRTQRPLARRVQGEYRRAGTRAAVMMVELIPILLTKAQRVGSLNEFTAVGLSLVIDTPSVLDAVVRSPKELAHVLALRALGGYSPSGGRVLFQNLVFGPSQPEILPITRRLIELYGRAYAEADEWSWPQRGGVLLAYEGAEKEYKALLAVRQSDAWMNRDLRFRMESNDAIELRFDPALVDDFVHLVEELRPTSERTFIYLMPRSPWVHPTAEGLARLERLISEVRERTGVQVIDLTNAPGFSRADFITTHHLAELGGREHFSTLLADEVARRL